jgi:hypothetical protein
VLFLLAPHIEIHFVQRIGFVALGEHAARYQNKRNTRGSDCDYFHPASSTAIRESLHGARLLR